MGDVLNALPTETLHTIANLLLPGTLFNLALTCKRSHQRLLHLVEEQKAFAKDYSSVDTRHPLSAVTALRRVLTDPIAAWHLRSIYMWRLPWSVVSWDDRAGQDDVDFLPHALTYPHVWSSPICKQVYKRMREQWRDFTDLQQIMDVSRDGPILQEAFVSDEEAKVFESLLQPFNSTHADHDPNDGGGRQILFLLIACAPRLRDIWHARPNESWIPWHCYLGKFFRRFHTLTNQHQSLHPDRDSDEILNGFGPQLPPGFSALRYVDLGEVTPFFKYERDRAPVRIEVVRHFLLLPNLELLRFAHIFHRSGSEDLNYTFEWEPRTGALRESIMTFTDDEEDVSPLDHWKFWPMKALSTAFRNRIVSYECSSGTVHDIQALRLCCGQTLRSLTFTDNTPRDLCKLLRKFSNLTTLTVGVDYLTRNEGNPSCDLVIAESLPASLEHLMVHSESYAKTAQDEGDTGEQWAQGMHELGSRLVLRIYHMLASDELPNLMSMCLVRIWGKTVPDQLDLVLALTTERKIDLHLWSGSPDPSTRTCADLCGRFVPTEVDKVRWPHGPRPWSFYSTYNWVTGSDEFQYGDRYTCKYPPLDDQYEMPKQFLHEWNENFFEKLLKESHIIPNEVGRLANLDLADGGVSLLDVDRLESLVEKLCERYKIAEDKARRVRESMSLGRKVVNQLGGEGGSLVCKDFKWQRVHK